MQWTGSSSSGRQRHPPQGPNSFEERAGYVGMGQSLEAGAETVDMRRLEQDLRLRAQKKRDLGEMRVYTVFLVFFIVVYFSGRDFTQTFYLHEAIREAFVNEEFREEYGTFIKKNWFDLSNIREFWQWLQGPVTTNLFPEELYNGQPLPPDRLYFVQTYNKLLGRIRLRQLRVEPDSCTLDKRFSRLGIKCFDYYSEADRDTAPIVLKNGEVNTWERDTGSISDWGIVIWFYDESGYVRDIPSNRTLWMQELELLKESNWIDVQTRAVFLDFLLFNINLSTLTVVEFSFEFSPGGTIVKIQELRTFRPDPYYRGVDKVVAVLEVGFLIFLAYYYVLWVRTIIESGRRNEPVYSAGQLYSEDLRSPDDGGSSRGQRKPRKYWLYFLSGWNCLETVNLLIFAAVIIFRIMFLVNPGRRNREVLVDKYVNFEWVSWLYVQESNLNAANFLLSVIKIFKFMRLNAKMNLLWKTLNRAADDIVPFLLFFFIVFFGFALMAHVFFGRDLWEFRNFGVAASSCFRVLLGAFDYDRLSRVNRILAPVFFAFFVFLVYLVMLNMFLAIINEAFIQQKRETAQSSDVLTQVKSFLGRAGKKFARLVRVVTRRKRDQVKVEEKQLSEEEIIRRLRSSTFFRNGRKHISFFDLRTALGPEVSTQQAMKIFRRLDADRSGTIELEELDAMARSGRKVGVSSVTVAQMAGRTWRAKAHGAPLVDHMESLRRSSDQHMGAGSGMEVLDSAAQQYPFAHLVDRMSQSQLRQLYSVQQSRIGDLERKVDKVSVLLERIRIGRRR